MPVVIHGGGKRISNKLNEAGIKSDFINGLRVTDEKSIDIVVEVLNNFNKEITEALKKNSCNSQAITNNQNNILMVEQEDQRLGFVGTPKKISQSIIEQIVKEKKVPVIAPLGLDKNNQVFNINADTAAGAIAKKLNARRLIIMSDVEGVLDDKKKLISEINTDKINELIQNNIISGGMIPKIQNCLDVASNGVKGVCIIDGRMNHSILFELLSNAGSGTLIRK
jgi:acetylglutamate kinase